MTPSELGGQPRIRRIHAILGDVAVHGSAITSLTPLVGVVSSRLGRDPSLHRIASQFLWRSLLDCRTRGSVLTVAAGSAIEPWARRAAELFGLDVITLTTETDTVKPKHSHNTVRVESADGQPLSRDRALIACADRLDAVYVRAGGIIEKAIRDRIETCDDATVRVAITGMPKCAGASLMSEGAIGWYCMHQRTVKADQVEPQPHYLIAPSTNDDAWTRSEGEWLVHCTRGPTGPWPNESEQQYRDRILLGDAPMSLPGPLQSLLRIVQCGRLLAAATASDRQYPVVCFSQVPLSELLSRRCFRSHLGRWDYEPYGVAIRLTAAQRYGFRPVIYGEPTQRGHLPADEQYRFQAVGEKYDWRLEREWRSEKSVDLTKIDPEDVRIFCADLPASRLALANCRWAVTFVPNDATAI